MSIPIKDAGRRHDLSFNPFGSLSSRNSLKEYITSHPNSQLRVIANAFDYDDFVFHILTAIFLF